MADITLNPVTPSTNGAIVTASNPLPVSLVSGAPVITNYTWASVPTPTSVAGKIVFVSNYGTKGSLLVSDGTRWKPVSGSAIIASQDVASSNIANAETIVLQYQFAAGMWQTTDRLQFKMTLLKSGTTDTGTLRIRVGTAGTTADTQIFTNTLLASSSRVASPFFDLRLESATTVQQLASAGATNIAFSYGNVSTSAFPGAVTVTSVAGNASFVNVSILSSSTNDTIALKDAQIQLIASAN